MLQVDDELRDRKNLETLRKLDPNVTNVIQSATHVTLYHFDAATVKWARYDCEGPLFIVKRETEPRFQIIIVNRLSRNNFFHAITPTFHSEVVEPYLIFKSVSDDGTPLIHGIWFPADQERERISDVLTKCIRTQAAGGGDVSVLQDPQQRQAQAAKEAAAAQRAAEQREVQERQQALVLKQQAAAAKQLERERAAARQKDATPPPPPPRQEAAAQKLQQAKPPRALAATPAGAAAPGVPLLTPGMILGEDKVPKLSINGGSAALDRAGLKEALLALLDDDTFLDAIHSKYAQVTVKA